MDMRACDKAPIVLEPPFASKAFRRVPNFIMVHNLTQRPAVDDGELFNFITDFSCMPANKPRLVLFARLDTDTVDALERRFDENIDSIGGQVCAVVKALVSPRVLTNMAVGRQKTTLALQLLRNA